MYLWYNYFNIMFKKSQGRFAEDFKVFRLQTAVTERAYPLSVFHPLTSVKEAR